MGTPREMCSHPGNRFVPVHTAPCMDLPLYFKRIWVEKQNSLAMSLTARFKEEPEKSDLLKSILSSHGHLSAHPHITILPEYILMLYCIAFLQGERDHASFFRYQDSN
jgi:hypothetical protein